MTNCRVIDWGAQTGFLTHHARVLGSLQPNHWKQAQAAQQDCARTGQEVSNTTWVHWLRFPSNSNRDWRSGLVAELKWLVFSSFSAPAQFRLTSWGVIFCMKKFNTWAHWLLGTSLSRTRLLIKHWVGSSSRWCDMHNSWPWNAVITFLDDGSVCWNTS